MLKRLKQLASESAVYGIAGALSRFIGIFLIPIYTRVFSKEDYGVMSLVLSSIALVGIFAKLALDNSAHRFFWDTDCERERKSYLSSWLYCQLVMSVGFALLIIVFAEPIAVFVIDDPSCGRYFQLLALTLPIGTVGSVLSNWFRMQRRPWAAVTYSISSTLATVLITVLLVVVLELGISGAFAAKLIVTVLAAIAAFLIMGDWLHPRHFSWRSLRPMLVFGLPLVPAAISFWVVAMVDNFFIQKYATTGDVGLYGIGYRLAGVVGLGTLAFRQAYGPFAYSLLGKPEAKQVYGSVLLAYLWTTCFVASVVSVLSPELLAVFTTKEYAGASSVVALLSFTNILTGLNYVGNLGCGIAKKTAPIATAITVGAIINVMLNWQLVPAFGKEGAAVSTMIATSVAPIYVFYKSQQYYPIPYRFGVAILFVVLYAATVFLGGAIRLESFPLRVVGKSMFVVAVFIPALFVFRIITLQQARTFVRRFRNRIEQPMEATK